MKSSRQLQFPDLYLSNGNRRIDYIIVYNEDDILKRRYYKAVMEYFVKRLKKLHIDYELSHYSKNNKIVFIKLHVAYEVLQEYAEIHNIELKCKSNCPHIAEPFIFHCLYNELTLCDPENPLHKRARETLSKSKPERLRQAERILLTNIILNETPYGNSVNEVGIKRLLQTGAAKAAFPLHEGKTAWKTEGLLTDRQLLAKYWYQFKYWANMQPLRVIENYFGPEMAFFYAYLQLTIGMMIIASILGIVFFIIGAVADPENPKIVKDYICQSDKVMCPTCNPSFCRSKPLKSFCDATYDLSQYFDNAEMFLLGILITLWGTIFLEIWTRKQGMYRLEWNLSSLDTDTNIRAGYEKQTDLLKISPITNELEPSMAPFHAEFRMFISAFAVLFFIVLLIGSQVLIIMLKRYLSIWMHNNITMPDLIIRNLNHILTIISSTVSVLVICIIDKVYVPVAEILTNWENPRTQTEYDNSFMLKCFLFAFFNNYTMLMYIAFFKGKFLTNPGDEEMYTIKGAYIGDICPPTGCNAELSIHIIFILGFKHVFIKCLGKFIFRIGPVTWRKYIQGKQVVELPQWECDFILKPFRRYGIMKQYTEIVLRHGFVLFFTCICPFTPFITLIVNIIEMKLYAYGFTTLYRRPIPRKVGGLELWYYILYSLTWLGVTINALLAILTKEFAARAYYSIKYGNLTKYIDRMFTAFALKDYAKPYYPDAEDDDVCYFIGYRYPRDHPQKYQTDTDSYHYIAFGWMVIVIYLHVVFLLTRLVAYFIPDTSSEVRDYMNASHAEDLREIRKFSRSHSPPEHILYARPVFNDSSSVESDDEN